MPFQVTERCLASWGRVETTNVRVAGVRSLLAGLDTRVPI